MVLLFAKILAFFGVDSLLYSLACEEEANEHYSKEKGKTNEGRSHAVNSGR